MRDSAGITIVENGAAPTRSAFAIDSTAATDIGDRGDDDPDYQLYSVRGAVRRSDGTIVVGNAGSGELRLYDARGQFVHRVGGKGKGPGELEDLAWVALAPGDTILTYDHEGRRLSRFTSDGLYVRSFALGGPSSGVFANPVGLLDDGRIAASGSTVFMAGERQSGMSRDSVPIMIVGSDGLIQDTIRSVVGTERLVRTTERGMTVSTPPYGRVTSYAARGDAIAYGTGDSYELSILNPSGVVRRIVRRRAAPVAVTSADLESLLMERMGGSIPAEAREQFQRQLAETERPEAMPPYSAIFLDRAGRLWVREATHRAELARWAVYDAEGALVAEIRLPARFRITDAGADFVLGILRDDDDLERVQLFRLRTSDGDA